MMDWTDRHCRYFLRGFSPDVLLYTEMITAAAILRGNRERLLAYDAAEHPLALQLGGSEPQDLATAARIGAEFGYDEINLNCGCPSDRVHSGAFGACLMLEPQRVADCVAAMKAVVRVPVTVKMRIGVVAGHTAEARSAIAQYTAGDAEALREFVAAVQAAGAAAVIVHARKAVLGGLSPKQNREVPPLRYEVVRAVKAEFPGLSVTLNGGLRQADDVHRGAVVVRWGDAGPRGLSSTLVAGGSCTRPSARIRPTVRRSPGRFWRGWRTTRPASSHAVSVCRASPATCWGCTRASPAPGNTGGC